VKKKKTSSNYKKLTFSFILSTTTKAVLFLSTMGKTKVSKNITVRDKLTNSPHPPAVQYDILPPWID
jgi:hypothetical protein